MKHFEEAFNLVNFPKIKERVKEYKKNILTNKEVIVFLNKHSSQITEEILNRDLIKLNEFTEQNQDCAHCQTLSSCTNLLEGHQPSLEMNDGQIILIYKPCEKEIVAEKKRQVQKLIQTIYLPLEVRNASFAEIVADTKDRGLAIQKLIQFEKDYLAGKNPKGLYLHGPFGRGKTFLLGALASELAEKGIASSMVYWPDYLRELKGSFEDNTSNQKIEALKKVPVLMIDDIGAETISAWARDDVLGSILQYRMHEKLATLFTSNFDFEELALHFSIMPKSEMKSEMKAKRIMERIEFLTEPVLVGGQNRRK